MGNEKKHLKENFVKKNTLTRIFQGAKIEFKTNENNFIDIRTSTFTNNKEYTKYLTSKSMEDTKREFF